MESKYNMTEIITQVGDIGEMISRMKTEGPIPAIEIDIVLEKIRNLYTSVSNLKEFNHPAANTGKATPEKARRSPGEAPDQNHARRENSGTLRK